MSLRGDVKRNLHKTSQLLYQEQYAAYDMKVGAPIQSPPSETTEI